MENHSGQGNRKRDDLEVHAPSLITLHWVKTVVPYWALWQNHLEGSVNMQVLGPKSNPHAVGKFWRSQKLGMKF